MEKKENTIEINGVSYYSMEYIKDNYIAKDSKWSSDKSQIANNVFDLMDSAHVMAMGSAQLDGEWVRVRVSYDYLSRALKSISHITEDSVTLAFGKDSLLAIGEVKDNNISGIFIAPKSDD